jgi:hypothetical protein
MLYNNKSLKEGTKLKRLTFTDFRLDRAQEGEIVLGYVSFTKFEDAALALASAAANGEATNAVKLLRWLEESPTKELDDLISRIISIEAKTRLPRNPKTGLPGKQPPKFVIDPNPEANVRVAWQCEERDTPNEGDGRKGFGKLTHVLLHHNAPAVSVTSPHAVSIEHRTAAAAGFEVPPAWKRHRGKV